MAKKRRRVFTKEFKLDAARLVAIQGFRQREVAERLGVNVWSVRQWIKKFRESGGLPPVDEPQPEAQELERRIRRRFESAKQVKTAATRKGSTERYLLARGFKA